MPRQIHKASIQMEEGFTYFARAARTLPEFEISFSLSSYICAKLLHTS